MAMSREERLRRQRLNQARYDKNRTISNSERGKIYYSQNKEKVLKKAKLKHSELRAEFIKAYGGRCVCCGEDNPKFLTLDHKKGNGAGSAHRKRYSGKEISSSRILRELKSQGWPWEDYQLLCFNCNCGRANNNGICPHKG